MTTSRLVPTKALFDLQFAPGVELISTVRRCVAAFCEQTVGDADSAARVAVASQELIENAVKYALDGTTRVRVELDAPARVTVRTWNRASAENVARLDRELELVRAAADPHEHYLAAMRRTVKVKNGPGMGLARISAESGAVLRHEADGETVMVEALIALGAEGSA